MTTTTVRLRFDPRRAPQQYRSATPATVAESPPPAPANAAVRVVPGRPAVSPTRPSAPPVAPKNSSEPYRGKYWSPTDADIPF